MPLPAVKQAFIADIDLIRLQQQGMVTPEGGRTAVAEDFRLIKRPLLRNVRERQGYHSNLIVVTSAMPREGKTYCAINLAMSIAMEMDNTVLLVDADVAHSSLLKVLGLPSHPGLMDILLGEKSELAEVILKTNVPGLSILPAGGTNKHATELLASRSMSRLLTDIAERYADRIVIFDAPPLLTTTEASVLAAQMGQVLVVVESETTTQRALREARGRLEQSPNIGLLFNKSTAFSGAEYHGHYD